MIIFPHAVDDNLTPSSISSFQNRLFTLPFHLCLTSHIDLDSLVTLPRCPYNSHYSSYPVVSISLIPYSLLQYSTPLNYILWTTVLIPLLVLLGARYGKPRYGNGSYSGYNNEPG